MNTFALKTIRMLSAAVLLVLLLSAYIATPAFADGETPPPPDGGATEETSTDGAADTATAVEEAPAEEDAPAEESAEEPVTEAADLIDTAAEVLAEVPEDTEVIVVNPEGDMVSLASEEAAEAIVYGDPIWCPTGVAPNPATPACTADYASISALVAGDVPTGNGTIWVASGAASANAIIDGTAGSWSGLGAFSLTIQGGWNGVYGSMALDPVNPYSTFNDVLWIHNWTGAVTVKNVIFDNATFATGADINALEVETSGNIVLDKVKIVTMSMGALAWLSGLRWITIAARAM
jgi:hypothetical protein